MYSSLKRVAMAGVLALGAVSLAGAQDVHTDYNHDVNFSDYRTFCVDRVHSASPLVEGRMRDAISSTLTRNGYTVTGGAAQYGSGGSDVIAGCDLAVRAISSVRDRREYTTFYQGWGPGWGYGGWRGGYGWGWGGGPAITTERDIPVGMLIVDVYDTRTRQLVFRGTSKTDVSSKAEKNTERLDKSVDKIFDKFPPKHT